MSGSGFLFDRRQALWAVAASGASLTFPAAVRAATERTGHMPVGRRLPFDDGWRFSKGAGTGFEAADFTDAGWRIVDLPHDWSIEDLPTDPADPSRIVGPFDKTREGGVLAGYATGGEGWYRKRFRLPPNFKGRVEAAFEGAYLECEAWLNGQRVGSHRNGYTPFAFDLTPYLKQGGDNVLAVRMRNLGYTARWHSGAGLYRHVWLNVLPEQARIAQWGVVGVTREVVGGSADVVIETRLEDVSPDVTLSTRLVDARGRTVWEGQARAEALVSQPATIAEAKLWSPDSPALYSIETELRRGAQVLDKSATPFGIRVLTFDAQTGMTLNGKPTKLRGGCIHHDHGILGAAAFDAAEDRKVALLKARGFNALRPSHNLFSPAFLDACDRHGVMVICEAFDIWNEKKFSDVDASRFFKEDWRKDLTAMVLSARAHPSVIIWSIGNEIPGRGTPEGIETQWRLANEVHRLDPTRPVTAAINGFPGHEMTPSAKSARAGAAGVADRGNTLFLDLVGYNYKLADYVPDHARYPNRVLYGSESFPKDVFAIWDLTDKTPWLIGDFVWTAMDYLGEVGIGGSDRGPVGTTRQVSPAGFPWINAFCGDLDLIGQQKPASFARDVVWGLSQLEMLVQRPVPEGMADVPRVWGWADELASWSWPGAEGQPLTVSVYTAGDRAELLLDGKPVASKGVAPTDMKHVTFEVPYAAGTLEAVAYHAGREIGRRKLETCGPAAGIRLVREDFGGGSTRGDISFVLVEVVDAKGRPVPDAELDLEVAAGGAGTLIAFGSANPLATGSYQSGKAKSWRGRALAVVRGQGRGGAARITASGAGLKPAVLSFGLDT